VIHGRVFRSGVLSRQFLLVQIVLENRFNAFIAQGANGHGPATGLFQPDVPILLAQTHDPQARPKALLGVWFSGHDGFDHLSGVWTGFPGPADQPPGTPVRMLLVALGHVLFDSGEASPFI